jgi:hypothetical protein
MNDTIQVYTYDYSLDTVDIYIYIANISQYRLYTMCYSLHIHSFNLCLLKYQIKNELSARLYMKFILISVFVEFDMIYTL